MTSASSAAVGSELLKETKPDFARARERWNHYWNGEILKRPPVVAEVRKPGVYRVEAWKGRRGWIFSNHVRIGE